MESDYVRNGLFCESGLAYNSNINEAMCASASKFVFDG